MLSYSGFLEITPPLSNEEVIFLNQWQELLNNVYIKIKNGDKEAAQEINSFLNFELNKNQLWTVCEWAYSPMISWENKGMRIEGSHKKGQLRQAVLGYLHFFLGEQPVLKNCVYNELSFIQKHVFNGIIDSCKEEKNSLYDPTLGYINPTLERKKWLYIIENNHFFSVEHCTKEQYINNPDSYYKDKKDDDCVEKLDRYFSKLYDYSKVVKIVYENNTNNKKEKRIKL